MTCFYNPKWRNYRTPTKKDILVFRHQIKNSFPFSPCLGPYQRLSLLNIHRRVQEKFRHDGWWICNRMDYSWRFQHLGQLKGTQQSWGQAWGTVLNPHGISYLFTVTHVMPVCSFGKWKCKKPEDDATISHQLHSPLWSPLRVPVIAGHSDRHRRTRSSRPAPPSSCYRSAQRRGRAARGGGALVPGGGRPKGGHGGPASGKREEGGRRPDPSRLHSQLQWSPFFTWEWLWNSGSGGGGAK